MKYALVVMAVLMPVTAACIVIFATIVGVYTGNWGWMMISILWFGVSLALSSLMLKKFYQNNREEA